MIMCDDISDITYIEVIKGLMELLKELSDPCSKADQKRIDILLTEWYTLILEWFMETQDLSITG